MDSVMNTTQSAEKRDRNKKYNHELQKQYEINKRRALIRKLNESNKEMKQNERRQKRKYKR